jgi:hypothetical protein
MNSSILNGYFETGDIQGWAADSFIGMDSETPLSGMFSAVFGFASAADTPSSLTQFVDLRNSALSWPWMDVNFSIPANVDLTDTTLMVHVYDVDTGELLNASTWDFGNIQGGLSSAFGTSLNQSMGHLVQIEISWMNASVTSGATIELDNISIWDGI